MPVDGLVITRWALTISLDAIATVWEFSSNCERVMLVVRFRRRFPAHVAFKQIATAFD